MPNGADKKLQQFRKFALPFYITKEQVKVQENIKGTPQLIAQIKENLLNGFFSKSSLKEVAESVTDNLDQTTGGLWLCNI